MNRIEQTVKYRSDLNTPLRKDILPQNSNNVSDIKSNMKNNESDSQVRNYIFMV